MGGIQMGGWDWSYAPYRNDGDAAPNCRDIL